MLGFLVFFPFIAGLLSCGAGVLCVRRNQKAGRPQGQETPRDVAVAAAVIIEFLLTVWLAVTLLRHGGGSLSLSVPEICGFGLNFALDGFRAVYGCIAAFMWMMTTLFSRQYFARHTNRNRFYLFLLWTLGATMGVFLSADLYTTFIFFEMMSFTSYVWVAQEENRPALRAAETYLAVAVTGGLVMLMGLFLLYHRLGTLAIDGLREAAAGCEDKGLLYAAGGCMLFGFGAKAGAFPLHIWLPKAHPVAPAPASALLSGILTKTGIYGILILTSRLFLHDKAWGQVVLVLGVITMLGGAVLAVFSVDIKRTLACSSMSQIGFILVGVGMQGLLGEENAPAVHGTVLHMINHSLIKLVLFMAAGVIYADVHALELNRIRGYGRRKPLLMAVFLAGALAIGGIPGFGGYVSKTLLHEAIIEYGGGAVMTAVEWIFLFSGGLTVAYMTKLFVAVFVEKNADAGLQESYDKRDGAYVSPATVFALTGSALVLLAWGFAPHALMDRAAELMQGFLNLKETGSRVSYFGVGNLRGGLISIAIGAAVYLLFIRRCLMKRGEDGVRRYVNGLPAWLDLENLLYRPALLVVLPAVFGVLCRIPDSFADGVVVALRKTVYRDSPLPHERPEGNAVSEALGRLLNLCQRVWNRFRRDGRTGCRDYVHLAAVKSAEIKENHFIISRSLSFGLLLACVGLMLTLLYIVWL